MMGIDRQVVGWGGVGGGCGGGMLVGCCSFGRGRLRTEEWRAACGISVCTGTSGGHRRDCSNTHLSIWFLSMNVQAVVGFSQQGPVVDLKMKYLCCILL